MEKLQRNQKNHISDKKESGDSNEMIQEKSPDKNNSPEVEIKEIENE